MGCDCRWCEDAKAWRHPQKRGVSVRRRAGKIALAVLAFGVAVLGVLALTGCGGANPAAPDMPELAAAASVGGGGGGAVGSIELRDGKVTFRIEGAARSNFIAQLWDKGKSGTSREIGRPVFEQKGLGNGELVVDASEFACLDLQADLGSEGGGLLAHRQFARWGTCPVPPPPPPPPTCEERGQSTAETDGCEPPPPTCETNPELCPPPPPTCETDPSLCPPPPPPVCDPAEYRVQSWENNKNRIKANVHVRGAGVWELKLFATDQLNEFPYNPDYTKSTDSEVIPCEGNPNQQGELKVEYDWKGHPSAYWWFILYYNGVPFYIEPYVTHAD